MSPGASVWGRLRALGRPGATLEETLVDFLTTLPLDRLLEPVGRVDAATLRRAQRAATMSL